MEYDFSGWATRNNIKCSDGRTIMKDAFKHNDGQTVPLVWNHQHNEAQNVLGHALLENREQGVYAYCKFNETESGKDAKMLVQHGDVTALSIYANKLKQNGGNVIHGAIREVSLVLAGANPGAFIDSVMVHGENTDEEAVIYSGEEISLAHADEEKDKEPEQKQEEPKMAESEKTVKDVFDTLNEEQKTVVYALIGQALEDAKGNKDEEESDVKHNVFDQEEEMQGNVLSHSEMAAVFSDAKRYGSLKDSVLAHGIEDIEYLFPDAQKMENAPSFIKREDAWVSTVMNGVHHSPFSRIKSMFADITEDDARALGYLSTYGRDAKGNKVLLDEEGHPTTAAYKKEEVFGLLKRTTTPTTVYKKQKLDRDDVVDITDFDVVGWIKTEMRGMLNEELARAILIGDGRLASSNDKINEQNIRPIAKDAGLFTIKTKITVPTGATADDKAKAFIKASVKSRKDYKGSGSPTLFTTEDILADMLLLEDGIGHRLYKTETELASAMRVSKIVTVPVMEGFKNEAGQDVLGIIVNLSDYNVGADKGGAVNMFDDFDIDYNAQKYLIETRCSGALTKPHSAIVVSVEAGSVTEPEFTIQATKAIA